MIEKLQYTQTAVYLFQLAKCVPLASYCRAVVQTLLDSAFVCFVFCAQFNLILFELNSNELILGEDNQIDNTTVTSHLNSG